MELKETRLVFIVPIIFSDPESITLHFLTPRPFVSSPYNSDFRGKDICGVWTPFCNIGNKTLLLSFPMLSLGDSLSSLHNSGPGRMECGYKSLFTELCSRKSMNREKARIVRRHEPTKETSWNKTVLQSSGLKYTQRSRMGEVQHVTCLTP